MVAALVLAVLKGGGEKSHKPIHIVRFPLPKQKKRPASTAPCHNPHNRHWCCSAQKMQPSTIFNKCRGCSMHACPHAMMNVSCTI